MTHYSVFVCLCVECIMSFKEYNPIMRIETCTIKWSIRVRIQALWHGITRESKTFRGINMLLIDDCVRYFNANL